MASKSIAIVAGEASGDLHGSRVINALSQRCPDIDVFGIGGHRLQTAGVEIVVQSDQLAVVGITEAFAKAYKLLQAMRRFKRLLTERTPDLLILIDFPDFNLHMAAAAKKLGIPVLYYISPQIWAWRANRIKKIKNRVDHMAVILPFEKTFYEQHKVPVSFVGHPLMDALTIDAPINASNHTPHHSKSEDPIVALLPGSREREVTRLLPVMLQAAHQINTRLEKVQFQISCAPSINEDLIRQIVQKQPLLKLKTISLPVKDILTQCHLAVAASGTVTLEAAIYGTPMIIAYAISPMSYWLGKVLVKVDHIGLVNLIAQKRIVPELVQKNVTATNIAAEVYRLLTDRRAYQHMQSDLAAVKHTLGKPGASQAVADIACQLMDSAYAA